MKVFRLKAIIPLSLFLALSIIVYLLLLDGIVRGGIEFVGSQITGARVDIESVEARPLSGRIVIRGIQAADPNDLMTNMVEMDELIADMRLAPLLQKKVVVDTMVIRGVRFGTPRTESGALPQKEQSAGEPSRRVAAWVRNLPIPEFSFKGLSETVDISSLETDSLATVIAARGIAAAADSFRDEWTAQVRGLNVSSEIDSARAIASRLQGINLRGLNLRRINEIKNTLSSANGFMRTLQRKGEDLSNLRESIESGMGDLRQRVESLDETRGIDQEYARGLLRIPSIEAPDIGPALFGEMARERIQPALDILDTIERHAPPGLGLKRKPGPKRLRMAGSSAEYPRRESYPRFLLVHGEFNLILGEEDRPEEYLLAINGLNSDPAVYGRPTGFNFERTSGGAGERIITASGVLDRTSSPSRDSIEVSLSGAGMGKVALGSLGGRLNLGIGEAGISLVRTGDGINATMLWECPAVQWESTGERSGVEAFVWQTLSSMREVSVTATMSGTSGEQRFTVESNVSSELSRALRRQLGEQIDRAEARIRSEVDQRIREYESQARTEVDAVISEIEDRLSGLRSQYDEARSEFEARLKNITDRLPSGIIPPISITP